MKLSPEQRTERMKKYIDGLGIPESEKDRMLNDAMIFINSGFWEW